MSESKSAPAPPAEDSPKWSLDHIASVVEGLCCARSGGVEPLTKINVSEVASNVKELFDDAELGEVELTDLYGSIATRARELGVRHPDYGALWGRALIVEGRVRPIKRLVSGEVQSTCFTTFSEFYDAAAQFESIETRRKHPITDVDINAFVQEHKEAIDKMVVLDRDFMLRGFGMMVLLRSYLLKFDGVVAEWPQFMYMRVALGLHAKHAIEAAKGDGEDGESKLDVERVLRDVKETYDILSMGMATHATPTLFNMGTSNPQGSSCAVMEVPEDSLEGGILDAHYKGAIMKKYSFGMSTAVHKVRGKGSLIHSTGAKSDGVPSMIKINNGYSNYINQGGRRKGSEAMYMADWHKDIFDFIAMKDPHRNKIDTATDLFYAVWTSDLFMKRVLEGGTWSLFCPTRAPKLNTTIGSEFEKAYLEYEAAGVAEKTVPAGDLFYTIVRMHFKAGMPYVLFKDQCNLLLNQNNIGVIKQSNLCAEVLLFTGKNEDGDDEIGVCNLASIALPKFIGEDGAFDFDALAKVTRVLVRNIDKLIDISFVPFKEMETSNRRNRPMGIGVQGLADVFASMGLEYGSSEALALDAQIAETMYFAAVSESADLAERLGAYPSFHSGPRGSPASRGHFQFDLYGAKPATDRYDWEALRTRMKKTGLRNSLLIAHMPTASTSNILGNSPGSEPCQANLYTQSVLSGEATVLNREMVRELERLGKWTPEVIDHLAKHEGSIAGVGGIPDRVKRLFRTVWEVDVETIVRHAAARAPYICQTQSMNLYMRRFETDTVADDRDKFEKVSRALFLAWQLKLKTGIYYLRTTPKKGGKQAAPGGGVITSGGGGGGVTTGAGDGKPREGAHGSDEECLGCGA